MMAILTLAFFMVSLLALSSDADAATLPVSGKAKVLNANNSYLNFSLNNSHVVIDNGTGFFSGYAWIDDIGWVAFGTTDNDDGPVTLNLVSGVVSGKAKVINSEDFLSFSTNNSNVTVELATGVFSGHVWSEDLGWIDFADTGVSSSPFTTTQTGASSTHTSETQSSQPSSGCSSPKPLSTSDLFQINTTKNSVKLFFTPLADTSTFFVSFSENPNAEEHGEQVTLIREGVQSHTIYQLKPNTTYYAKVRGQNGCSPGDWSNIVKLKTDSKTYYKSSTISQKVVSLFKKVTNQLVVKPVQVNQVDQVKADQHIATQPAPISSKSKKQCILWWCW